MLEPPLHPSFLEQHLGYVPPTAGLVEFDLRHWMGIKIPSTEPGPAAPDLYETLAMPVESSLTASSIDPCRNGLGHGLGLAVGKHAGFSPNPPKEGVGLAS